MAWILRLVKIGTEGDGQYMDIMEINRPDDLGDIADLGLTLAEGKLLLAGIQRELVAAQARDHAVRRPDCLRCGGVCHVKDYRDHTVAMLFGEVTVRLPRFRCAACGGIELGIRWPSHCRSTPELDQLQAHLSALMPYRAAADILEQLFPVGAGKDKETLRRHTLKAGAAIRECAAISPETAAPGITITLDSTFIRSSQGDCLEIGGIRPQPLLAGADHWRVGISVRSRSRACHYRRRCEPEAEDPPLAATSASAATCSSGGSPENWLSLR